MMAICVISQPQLIMALYIIFHVGECSKDLLIISCSFQFCTFSISWCEEIRHLGQGCSWDAFWKAFIHWWSQLAVTGFARSCFSVGKLAL